MLCTSEKVSDILSSLNIEKFTGPDELPNMFLKNCSETVCVPLSLLFRKIPNKGGFHTQWKTSIVCPLYKEGDRSSAEHYRPICLLSNVSNFLGRVVFNRIFESTQHLISDNQYGFRKKRSTTVEYELSRGNRTPFRMSTGSLSTKSFPQTLLTHFP